MGYAKFLFAYRKLTHVYYKCDYHIVFTQKVSISEYTGILKRKVVIKLFKSYPYLKQNPYWGNPFWSRGYFVSTVGLDEDMIKRYVTS